MGTPNKNGVSFEQQLRQVEKTTKKAPADLEEYRKCAKEMSKSRLWGLFWDIRAGLCGDTPLSSVEIKAYFEIMEEKRSVGKVRLLKIMDRAYIQARLS